jgi:cytidine deaminase
MHEKTFAFQYEEYPSERELSHTDAILLQAAREATRHAYAPYSHFRVGAAAQLTNGVVLTGSNQENASFPAGICAERTLLSVASAQHPGMAIDTLAISYHNENGISDQPISPCGICRQSLQEFEQRTGGIIRLILAGLEGKVLVISSASLLLPLGFTADKLKP